jgi:hypothetical protein
MSMTTPKRPRHPTQKVQNSSLELTLHQVVVLARRGTTTKAAFLRAITWRTGSTLYLGKHVLEQSVRNTLTDQMDEFINDYLKENPKK